MTHMLGKLNFNVALGVLLFGLSTVISALLSFWYSDAERSWRGLGRHLVPLGTLAHPSARTDLWFFLSRKVVALVVIVPGVAFAVTVGTSVTTVLHEWLPFDPASVSQNASMPLLLAFTVTMFVVYDFSYYLYHRAQHEIPFLWELHKVHHSAELMVIVTRDRVHPLDEWMNYLWDGVIVGLVYAVWLFFAYNPVELTIYGMSARRFVKIITLEVARHTHYKISYGRIGDKLLVSPHYHQLHHSAAREHWDRNYGLVFCIWDRLFGTIYEPKPNEAFVFGLGHGVDHSGYRTWTGLYIRPVVQMSQMVMAWVHRRPAVTAMEAAQGEIRSEPAGRPWVFSARLTAPMSPPDPADTCA